MDGWKYAATSRDPVLVIYTSAPCPAAFTQAIEAFAQLYREKI